MNLSNLLLVSCESKLFNVPNGLNVKDKLEKMSKILFLRKAVSVLYKNGYVLISVLHDLKNRFNHSYTMSPLTTFRTLGF